jgi:hypothetical protein
LLLSRLLLSEMAVNYKLPEHCFAENWEVDNIEINSHKSLNCLCRWIQPCQSPIYTRLMRQMEPAIFYMIIRSNEYFPAALRFI